LLYCMAAAVTTRSEALLATLLLAVSYHHVWFSQNARGYTALLCFTLCATLLFVRLVERPRRRLAIAYGLAAGLGIYTHLTMAFVVVAHAMVWGWQAWRDEGPERSRRIRTAMLALGAAGLVGGLLYLPMAGQVYRFFSGPPQATAAVATPRWALLEILRGLRIGFGTVGLLAAFGLLLAGGLSYLRRSPMIAWLFVLPGGLTAAAMVLMHAPIRPRFFFSLLGFALMLLVRGAIDCGRMVQRGTAFGDRQAGTAGTVLVAMVAIVSTWSLRYNYRYPKQDFAGALQFIEGRRKASEPVLTAGLARYPYARYYQMPWIEIEKPEQLEDLRSRAGRAWVVYSFPEYMDQALVEKIGRHCILQQIFPGTVGGGDLVVCTTVGGSE
jgi:mannosyltransferase